MKKSRRLKGEGRDDGKGERIEKERKGSKGFGKGGARRWGRREGRIYGKLEGLVGEEGRKEKRREGPENE